MSRKVSAIVLAGGQGRRFNYEDKGLIKWRGTPLIAHVIKRIQPQVDQIIINCNRNVEEYRLLGYTLCQDILPEYQGPLAGIQSALTLTDHSFSLICPCDTPELPQNLTTTLLTALINSNSDIAYPKTDAREHYLPALIRSNLLASLNEYLKMNDRSMKGWYSTLNSIDVHFSLVDGSFLNVNTPDLL